MFADASKEARGPAEQHMFLDRPVKDLGIRAYLAVNLGNRLRLQGWPAHVGHGRMGEECFPFGLPDAPARRARGWRPMRQVDMPSVRAVP